MTAREQAEHLAREVAPMLLRQAADAIQEALAAARREGRAEEREACAALCEELAAKLEQTEPGRFPAVGIEYGSAMGRRLAVRIRALAKE